MDSRNITAHDAGVRFQDISRMLRTYWKGVLLICVLCLGAALALSLVQPKTYNSTATGLVVAQGEQDLASALAGDNLAQSKAISYESLATSRTVAEGVIERANLSMTPEELLENVSTEAPIDTVEIRVTVSADSPEAAADLANAWVVELAEQVAILESAGDAEAGMMNRVIVQPLGNASLPLYPSAPRPKLNLAFGLLGGLALGFVYAFGRYKMDRRIRSVEELRDQFGVAVLGVIPKHEKLTDQRTIVESGVSGGNGVREYSEALRQLRTNFSFVSVDRPPRTVVITSSLPGEGKSSITANLAVAIASTGRKVVVVDGDLRRPVMTEMFGLVPDVGLTDVLTGQVQIDEVLQPYDRFPNLQVLGAGQTPPNPTELLSSRTMHDLLEKLAEDALVLIDAPPLLPVTDAALLAAAADGAIIVTTAHVTTKDEFAKSLEHLSNVKAKMLGVVLNRVPTRGPETGYYGYYGRKSYHASDESTQPKEVTGSHPHGLEAYHRRESGSKAGW